MLLFVTRTAAAPRTGTSLRMLRSPADQAVPTEHIGSLPIKPSKTQAPAVEPAVDPHIRTRLAEDRESRLLEQQSTEGEEIADSRHEGRAGRPEGARQERRNGDGSSIRHVMTRDAADRGVLKRENALDHASRFEELGPHCLLPHATGDRLDRPTHKRVPGVRIRPWNGRRFLGRDARREPGERVIASVGGLESELQPATERHPGSVGEQVAESGRSSPTGACEFRHMRGDAIVETKTASSGQPCHDRRDHRLRQRAHGKAAARIDRCVSPHVLDPVGGHRADPVVEDPTEAPGML